MKYVNRIGLESVTECSQSTYSQYNMVNLAVHNELEERERNRRNALTKEGRSNELGQQCNDRWACSLSGFIFANFIFDHAFVQLGEFVSL